MKSKGQRWFRTYAADVDDANLRLLAFEDRWHWHAINCLKCAGELDSGDSGPLLQRKIAVKLGLQLRELEAVAMRLAEFDLIDPKTFQPLDWNERQFLSDTSTDRVRAFRERQKKPQNGDETFQKRRARHGARREGNVSETAPDTDTDSERTTTATITANALDWGALPQITTEQRVVVVGQMEGLDNSRQQDVLDELAGALRTKVIKGQWPSWLHRVIQKAMEDDFRPSLALAIQTERRQRIESQQLAVKRQSEAAERATRNSDPEVQAKRKAASEAARKALFGT